RCCQHAQARTGTSCNRDQDARNTQFACDIYCMQRACTTCCNHGEVAWVVTVFCDVDTCCTGHVFVDHVANIGSSFVGLHAQFASQQPHGCTYQFQAERHFTAQELVGVQITQHQISISHRWISTT